MGCHAHVVNIEAVPETVAIRPGHIRTARNLAESHFSQFSKDKDGVLRLEPGARATISGSTFLNNEVATGKPNAVAAGPVMGLYAGLGSASQGAAAWFHDCEFGGSMSSVSGEVAVENRNCRVYSNTKLPRVWDLQLERELSAWPLAQPDGSESGAAGGQLQEDVFADVEAGPSSDFLRPSDDFIVRIMREEAISTKLPSANPSSLPAGTDFITRDPYAGISEDEGFWTSKNIGLIAGLGGGAVLLALAALLAAWCFYFRKNSDVDKVRSVPCPPPPPQAEYQLSGRLDPPHRSALPSHVPVAAPAPQVPQGAPRHVPVTAKFPLSC